MYIIFNRIKPAFIFVLHGTKAAVLFEKYLFILVIQQRKRIQIIYNAVPSGSFHRRTGIFAVFYFAVFGKLVNGGKIAFYIAFGLFGIKIAFNVTQI